MPKALRDILDELRLEEGQELTTDMPQPQQEAAVPQPRESMSIPVRRDLPLGSLMPMRAGEEMITPLTTVPREAPDIQYLEGSMTGPRPPMSGLRAEPTVPERMAQYPGGRKPRADFAREVISAPIGGLVAETAMGGARAWRGLTGITQASLEGAREAWNESMRAGAALADLPELRQLETGPVPPRTAEVALTIVGHLGWWGPGVAAAKRLGLGPLLQSMAGGATASGVPTLDIEDAVRGAVVTGGIHAGLAVGKALVNKLIEAAYQAPPFPIPEGGRIISGTEVATPSGGRILAGKQAEAAISPAQAPEVVGRGTEHLAGPALAAPPTALARVPQEEVERTVNAMLRRVVKRVQDANIPIPGAAMATGPLGAPQPFRPRPPKAEPRIEEPTGLEIFDEALGEPTAPPPLESEELAGMLGEGAEAESWRRQIAQQVPINANVEEARRTLENDFPNHPERVDFGMAVWREAQEGKGPAAYRIRRAEGEAAPLPKVAPAAPAEAAPAPVEAEAPAPPRQPPREPPAVPAAAPAPEPEPRPGELPYAVTEPPPAALPELAPAEAVGMLEAADRESALELLGQAGRYARELEAGRIVEEATVPATGRTIKQTIRAAIRGIEADPRIELTDKQLNEYLFLAAQRASGKGYRAGRLDVKADEAQMLDFVEQHVPKRMAGLVNRSLGKIIKTGNFTENARAEFVNGINHAVARGVHQELVNDARTAIKEASAARRGMPAEEQAQLDDLLDAVATSRPLPDTIRRIEANMEWLRRRAGERGDPAAEPTRAMQAELDTLRSLGKPRVSDLDDESLVDLARLAREVVQRATRHKALNAALHDMEFDDIRGQVVGQIEAKGKGRMVPKIEAAGGEIPKRSWVRSWFRNRDSLSPDTVSVDLAGDDWDGMTHRVLVDEPVSGYERKLALDMKYDAAEKAAWEAFAPTVGARPTAAGMGKYLNEKVTIDLPAHAGRGAIPVAPGGRKLTLTRDELMYDALLLSREKTLLAMARGKGMGGIHHAGRLGPTFLSTEAMDRLLAHPETQAVLRLGKQLQQFVVDEVGPAVARQHKIDTGNDFNLENDYVPSRAHRIAPQEPRPAYRTVHDALDWSALKEIKGSPIYEGMGGRAALRGAVSKGGMYSNMWPSIADARRVIEHPEMQEAIHRNLRNGQEYIDAVRGYLADAEGMNALAPDVIERDMGMIYRNVHRAGIIGKVYVVGYQPLSILAFPEVTGWLPWSQGLGAMLMGGRTAENFIAIGELIDAEYPILAHRARRMDMYEHESGIAGGARGKGMLAKLGQFWDKGYRIVMMADTGTIRAGTAGVLEAHGVDVDEMIWRAADEPGGPGRRSVEEMQEYIRQHADDPDRLHRDVNRAVRTTQVGGGPYGLTPTQLKAKTNILWALWRTIFMSQPFKYFGMLVRELSAGHPLRALAYVLAPVAATSMLLEGCRRKSIKASDKVVGKVAETVGAIKEGARVPAKSTDTGYWGTVLQRFMGTLGFGGQLGATVLRAVQRVRDPYVTGQGASAGANVVADLVMGIGEAAGRIEKGIEDELADKEGRKPFVETLRRAAPALSRVIGTLTGAPTEAVRIQGRALFAPPELKAEAAGRALWKLTASKPVKRAVADELRTTMVEESDAAFAKRVKKDEEVRAKAVEELEDLGLTDEEIIGAFREAGRKRIKGVLRQPDMEGDRTLIDVGDPVSREYARRRLALDEWLAARKAAKGGSQTVPSPGQLRNLLQEIQGEDGKPTAPIAR